MSLLGTIFPKARAETIRLLFTDPGRELYLRDLTRRSGLALRSMQIELQKLVSVDLISCRRDGNRLYYRARVEHPVFQDLHNLALKTAGLVDVLAEAIKVVDGVEIAFVFGSLAQGDGSGRAGSDVDLMVIGETGLRDLAPQTSKASAILGREVNAHVLTEKEWAARLGAGDHFISEVVSKGKLFVKGTPDELERMGQSGVDPPV